MGSWLWQLQRMDRWQVKEILYILSRNGSYIQEWSPFLGVKNVSLNAFWLLELPNQNRRKILFLQTTWQSKVIINLISFQKVALWENCIEYILYMEDFWPLQLNQMLEMKERLSTKRVVAHLWWQLLHHEKFTNYSKFDLTKYKYFPCDKIWRTEMDWWGDLGYSLVYKIFEKTYLISGWTSC